MMQRLKGFLATGVELAAVALFLVAIAVLAALASPAHAGECLRRPDLSVGGHWRWRYENHRDGPRCWHLGRSDRTDARQMRRIKTAPTVRRRDARDLAAVQERPFAVASLTGGADRAAGVAPLWRALENAQAVESQAFANAIAPSAIAPASPPPAVPVAQCPVVTHDVRPLVVERQAHPSPVLVGLMLALGAALGFSAAMAFILVLEKRRLRRLNSAIAEMDDTVQHRRSAFPSPVALSGAVWPPEAMGAPTGAP